MKTLITLTLAAVVSASAASASLSQVDRDNSGTISASEFLHVYGPDACQIAQYASGGGCPSPCFPPAWKRPVRYARPFLQSINRGEIRL